MILAIKPANHLSRYNKINIMTNYPARDMLRENLLESPYKTLSGHTSYTVETWRVEHSEDSGDLQL